MRVSKGNGGKRQGYGDNLPSPDVVDDSLDQARALYGDVKLFAVANSPDRSLILRYARWMRYRAEAGKTGKRKKQARIPWGAAILKAAYDLNKRRKG